MITIANAFSPRQELFRKQWDCLWGLPEELRTGVVDRVLELVDAKRARAYSSLTVWSREKGFLGLVEASLADAPS